MQFENFKLAKVKKKLMEGRRCLLLLLLLLSAPSAIFQCLHGLLVPRKGLFTKDKALWHLKVFCRTVISTLSEKWGYCSDIRWRLVNKISVESNMLTHASHDHTNKDPHTLSRWHRFIVPDIVENVWKIKHSDMWVSHLFGLCWPLS